MRAMLVSGNKVFSPELSSSLEEGGFQIFGFESGTAALLMIADNFFELVIVDDKLSDMSGIEFVRKMITKSPMVNCALASPLSTGKFHEATEGLGILMQLPLQPGRADAEKLLGHLRRIMNLMNGSAG